MRADLHKIVQSIGYLANMADNGQIAKVPCLKLLYLADRYHLRKYGRTITNDTYYAMEKGPVPSCAKIAFDHHQSLNSDELAYLNGSLRIKADRKGEEQARPVHGVDMRALSKTDVEALDAAWKVYETHRTDLVEYTHTFPEWERHKGELTTEHRTRVRMSLDDFFLDAPKEYCTAEPELVRLNRECFYGN